MGEEDGSERFGGKIGEILGSFLALVLVSGFGIGEGIWLISHKVAASFLADTETSLDSEVLVMWGGVGEGFKSSGLDKAKALDLAAVFHVGTGVVDPAFFPTRIARLTLYFWTNEEDEDDEQPLFLILQPPLLLFASMFWFRHDIFIYLLNDLE